MEKRDTEYKLKRLAMKKLLVSIVVLLSFTGCIAVIGAAGISGVLGYQYIKGELKITYNRSFEDVWEATNKALKDLDLKIIGKRSDKVEGLILARTAFGKKVKIKVVYNGKFTKVSIRVGTLGDRDYSLAIKYRIDSYLKQQ